jgi:hypothetical protein
MRCDAKLCHRCVRIAANTLTQDYLFSAPQHCRRLEAVAFGLARVRVTAVSPIVVSGYLWAGQTGGGKTPPSPRGIDW